MDFVPVCLIKKRQVVQVPAVAGSRQSRRPGFHCEHLVSGRPGNTEPRQTDQLFERDIRRRSGVGCKLTDVVVEPIGGEVQFCRDLYNKRLEVLTRPKNCVHGLSAFTQTVGEQSERINYALLVHTTRRRRRRK